MLSPDPPDPDTPPLPWLDKPGTAAPAAQSWAATTPTDDVLLTARYRMTAVAFLRINLYIFWRAIPSFGLLSLLMGLVGALTVAFTPSFRGYYATVPWYGLILLAYAFIGSSLLFSFILSVPVPIATIFISPLVGLVGLFGKRRTTRLTPAGIPDDQMWVTRKCKWARFGRIEIRGGGDIFFIMSPVMAGCFAIPREAFADADAAQRFYLAAYALWQTNGNREAVPEAARAEFPPSSD